MDTVPVRHRSTFPFAQSPGRPLRGYLLSAVAVGLATLLGLVVRPHLDPTNIALIYLLAVVLSATRWGLGPSIFCSIAAVLAFDVTFVPPYGTLAVENTQYFLTFAIFILVAVIISELGARVRSQVALAEEREQQTIALYDLARGIAFTTDPGEILETAVKQVNQIFDVETTILLSDSASPPVLSQGAGFGEAARNASSHTFEKGEASGYGTNLFADSEVFFLPLATAQGRLGVLGVRPRAGGLMISPEQRRLLETFAGQIAVALEHSKLSAQAEQARLLEATDRFRSALLSSISHDLRTPLAAIMGSVTSLLDEGAQLTSQARFDLLMTIEEDAARLNRLVGNLLNMTKLEAGALKPERDWHSIEEVIGAALARMRTNEREIKVDIEPDLPLVPLDFVLIEQVMLNLLDNAIKFSPAGSPIEICARRENDLMRVSVSDHGVGIPASELEAIFEKFHRVKASGAPGTGLGLSICKGIVEAHHGRIWAERRSEGGARITFTLPAPEFEMHHE